ARQLSRGPGEAVRDAAVAVPVVAVGVARVLVRGPAVAVPGAAVAVPRAAVAVPGTEGIRGHGRLVAAAWRSAVSALVAGLAWVTGGRPALGRGRLRPALLTRRLAMRRVVTHISIHGPAISCRLIFAPGLTNG